MHTVIFQSVHLAKRRRPKCQNALLLPVSCNKVPREGGYFTRKGRARKDEIEKEGRRIMYPTLAREEGDIKEMLLHLVKKPPPVPVGSSTRRCVSSWDIRIWLEKKRRRKLVAASATLRPMAT